MKASQLKSLIFSRFKAGIKRPLLIESAPGSGKTQIVGQVAKELGVGFIALHAPLLEPSDYGFPIISAKRDSVNFVVSTSKFPMEGSDHPENGFLLLDDMAQAPPEAQKILANLIQEREIHGHRLKDGWTIIATGNRTTDRAGSNRVLSHLANRMTRVPLAVDLNDWKDWAWANNVKMEVISFLNFKADLLSNFDPHQDVNATPRAWVEGVSAALGVIDPALEFEVFSGDVGEGPASEFRAYLKLFRDLPDPDDIIKDPTGSDVPPVSKPDILYALCGTLAERTDEKNFLKIMTYINRCPAEFQVLYIRDATGKNQNLMNTKPFITWAMGPGAKILANTGRRSKGKN